MTQRLPPISSTATRDQQLAAPRVDDPEFGRFVRRELRGPIVGELAVRVARDCGPVPLSSRER